MNWIDPNKRMPQDGEEVLAVVSGERGGIRYENDVVSAIRDEGCWFLDDGAVAEAEDGRLTVTAWAPMPEPPKARLPIMIDAGELLNRIVLISASAGQWTAQRVIREIETEIRRMMLNN